jgi:2-isopropylmalate synthase
MFPDVPLELHLHDDRGLALANALAGLDAGAQWLSTSVNGLGERVGIVDTCCLLANLHFRGDRPLAPGIDLHDLSRLVADATGLHVHPQQPVTGRHANTHTSPLHVAAVKKDECSYAWISPKTFGRRTQAFANGDQFKRHTTGQRPPLNRQTRRTPHPV